MERFFLQPFSLLALTQAIFAFFALLYLVLITNKSRTTWMLILAVGGLLLLWMSEFFNLSTTFNYGSITAIMGSIVLFGFLHFAYAFHENPFPRESKSIFWVTLVGLAGFILYHTNLLVKSADLSASDFIAQELFNVSLIVWAALVLWRKKLRIDQNEVGFQRKTQALRAFALLLLAIIPLSFRNIWTTTHSSDLWADSVQYLGFAVLLVAFVVIYINHSSKPTTFMVKLVGLSLATVLIVLALTTLILYPDHELRNSSRAGLPTLQSMRFEPDDGRGYQFAHLPLQFDTNRGDNLGLAVEGDSLVSLGFAFPFYGKEWDTMFIDSNGLVTFGAPYEATQFQYFLEGRQPKIAPYYRALIPMSSGRSGVYYKRAEDKVIVTWYRVRERYDKHPGNENSFQLVLYRNGAIEFVYDTIEAQSLYGYRGLHPGGITPPMEAAQFTTTTENAIANVLLPEGSTIRFEPDNTDKYRFAKTANSYESDIGEDLQLGNGDAMAVSLGFAFPFFGVLRDSVIISDNGAISMGHSIYSSEKAWFNPYDAIYKELPIIAPLFDDLNPLQHGGVYFNPTSDKATITWHEIPRLGSDNTNTVQLSLYPNGMIDFTYEAIGESDFALDLWGMYSGGTQSPLDASRYLMATSSNASPRNSGLYEDFRSTEELAFLKYRHERMRPFFFLILGSSLFIVAVFPLFFRLSLVSPLAALLHGVDRVNAGDLKIQVPVHVNDEIGVLTHNFNSMTTTLKTAQEQLRTYAESLEEKVDERTAALQKTLQHLKTTQDQLIQAEKQASLGQLTAGIAHEIENPLNFINNFAELTFELAQELEEEIGSDSESALELLTMLKANAEKINAHGQRADAIVKGMLAHSQSRPGSREIVDLSRFLKGQIDIASHNMKTKFPDLDVDIEYNFAEEITQAELIPAEISRVISNMINNAFYELNQKAMTAPFAAKIGVETKLKDDFVEIYVHDNGRGISSEMQKRVFEPFFTTKPTGEGNTGLGLSLSYDIISHGHGGSLRIDSTEGKGATFVITLPTCESTKPSSK